MSRARRPRRPAAPRGERPFPTGAPVALAIVDPQRLFCDPASPAFLPAWPAARENALALALAFAAAGRPVVVSLHRPDPALPDPAFDALFDRRIDPADPLAAPEAAFAALEGVTRIDKPRFPLFSAPEAVLAFAGCGILVIAGVQTNLCVLATALAAAERGMIPIIARDATAARTAALHEAALSVAASGHAFVAPTAALLAAFGGAPRP